MTTADSTSTDDDPGRFSARAWLLPALTFLLGCLLTGVVIGVGTADGTRVLGAPAPTTADGEQGDGELLDEDLVDDDPVDGDVDAPEPSDVPRDVPDACSQAADRARDAADRADEVAAAVRDLDALRLQQLVDDLQHSQPEVERLTASCRDAAGDGPQDGDAGQATPTTSPAA